MKSPFVAAAAMQVEYELDRQLYADVAVEACRYDVGRAKIEISMKKADSTKAVGACLLLGSCKQHLALIPIKHLALCMGGARWQPAQSR
jgi:hypothetical protein